MRPTHAVIALNKATVERRKCYRFPLLIQRFNGATIYDSFGVAISTADKDGPQKKVLNPAKPRSPKHHYNSHEINIPPVTMKVLTLNFLTCAVKACKSSSASFPLHPKDAELVQDEVELNPKLLVNILPRIDWPALMTTSAEVIMTSYLFGVGDEVAIADTLSLARLPNPPSACANRRRARRGREDAEGVAPAIDGDADDGGEAGVWELRARICGQGGDRELLAPESFGLRTSVNVKY
jgi:hypothetical protein